LGSLGLRGRQEDSSAQIRIGARHHKYASFSPLDKTAFSPDVVVLVCSAKDVIRAVEASAYESGIAAKGRTGRLLHCYSGSLSDW
jgi:hypothetical protein